MNWILAFTHLLTLSSQALAQNGYTYQPPIEPFTGGTIKYPGTAQPERPGIGTTFNKYPNSQETGAPQGPGERPGSQQPGGPQGMYSDIQRPSSPQNSGGYPENQLDGSGGYPGTNAIRAPQVFGGYSETQQSSGQTAGPFTGYPSGRPDGPTFPQRPAGISPQGADGQLRRQKVGSSQRPSSYPDVGPSAPQGPAEYSGIQRPTGPVTAVFNGYPSGRSESTFSQSQFPGSSNFQSPTGSQGHSGQQKPTGPEARNGPKASRKPQDPNGLQGPNISHKPSGPQESQGSVRQEGPRDQPKQQKTRPNIQSFSNRPTSYVPSLGLQGSGDTHSEPQIPSRPQRPDTPQGSREPQKSNGAQGVNRPQDYNGREGPRISTSPMYPRPEGRSEGSGEPEIPRDAGSQGIGKPSRTYLPGQVSFGVSHPVGQGISDIPITTNGSGRLGVPGAHGDSNLSGIPGGPVAPGVPSITSATGTSDVPGTPRESFSGVPIGPLPRISGTGVFDEGNYEGDYSAIPGEPDIDYPVYSEIPETSFNCDQQEYLGYYADVETRCQVFHVCASNKTYDFLCPNGTIFHQEYLVCVWWNQFDCNAAPSLYGINANIYDYFISGQLPGAVPSGFPEQGFTSEYPGTQGPARFTPQGPSGSQESNGPVGSGGSKDFGTQQESRGSQGPNESEGSRGPVIYPQSSLSLEAQQPSTGFLESSRPRTPSREYLPQVSR